MKPLVTIAACILCTVFVFAREDNNTRILNMKDFKHDSGQLFSADSFKSMRHTIIREIQRGADPNGKKRETFVFRKVLAVPYTKFDIPVHFENIVCDTFANFSYDTFTSRVFFNYSLFAKNVDFSGAHFKDIVFF